MWAYVTLFAWSFAAATVLPLGSEPAVVYMVAQGHHVPMIVAIATLGNYLGACTTYGIGRGVRSTLAKPSPGTERATRIVNRYGAPALLLSWIPILGDAIVAAAGLARMRFLPFSAWTIAGKLARYIAVAYGASYIT
jgi:membrane protein YqaA with SNARE-associated domain